MKPLLAASAAIVLFWSLGGDAQAAAVFAIAPSTNTSSAGTAPFHGDLDGSGGPFGTGTAALTLRAYTKHLPFNVSVLANGSDAGTTDIAFTLTLHNQVGMGNEDISSDPGTQLQLGNGGDDIGPIDLQLFGGSATFTGSSSGTSGAVTAAGNLISSTHLRIGGLNGGGFAIGNGQSGTLNFTVNIPDSGATFQLITTANPEPTSLALAGLGMCLFGGGGYLRRRKRRLKTATDG